MEFSAITLLKQELIDKPSPSYELYNVQGCYVIACKRYISHINNILKL